jgi:hypothetical protein
MPARPVLTAGVAALLLAAGCAPRLDVKSTFTLEAGAARRIDLPAVSKPQRVVVEFTSSAADVSVYLVKNFREKDGMDEAPPKKEQTLDTKRGRSGTLTADVSPDTETRVVVREADRTTEVVVSVTNRR